MHEQFLLIVTEKKSEFPKLRYTHQGADFQGKFLQRRHLANKPWDTGKTNCLLWSCWTRKGCYCRKVIEDMSVRNSIFCKCDNPTEIYKLYYELFICRKMPL